MISFGSNGGETQQSSVSGFQALSPEIKQAFNDLATQAQGLLPGNNSSTTDMFTRSKSTRLNSSH